MWLFVYLTAKWREVECRIPHHPPLWRSETLGPSSGLVCAQHLGELPKLPFKIRSLHYCPLANFWLDCLTKDLLLHLFSPKANSFGWCLPFRRLTGPLPGPPTGKPMPGCRVFLMLHPGSMHPGEALVDLPMNSLSSHATVSRAPPQLAADPRCSEVLSPRVLTNLIEPCLKNGPGLAAVG